MTRILQTVSIHHLTPEKIKGLNPILGFVQTFLRSKVRII
uniref:Uncharacterized protein n=1 Tax=Anguilla anguilla TaxID=7936 RepID=A0A0E9Q7H0_ANGAN